MDIEERLRKIGIDGLVPERFLRRFLEGKIDPETGKDSDQYRYTYEQQMLLVELGEAAKAKINALPAFSQPVWISAAGGPGAKKTTALLQFVADAFNIDTSDLQPEDWKQPSLYKVLRSILPRLPAVWVSADRGGLLALAEDAGHPETSDKAFYLKWRWGTNFLSNLAMNLGFAGKKNIVHDTTLGSEHALANLEKAHQAGYYVVAMVGASPLATRQAASDKRNEVFFQSLPRNVTEQDRVFGENLPGIVAKADEVHIMWSDRADEPPRKIALIKQSLFLGIQDPAAFEKLCALYPAMNQMKPTLDVDTQLASDLPLYIRGQQSRNRLVARLLTSRAAQWVRNLRRH